MSENTYSITNKYYTKEKKKTKVISTKVSPEEYEAYKIIVKELQGYRRRRTGYNKYYTVSEILRDALTNFLSNYGYTKIKIDVFVKTKDANVLKMTY